MAQADAKLVISINLAHRQLLLSINLAQRPSCDDVLMLHDATSAFII